MRRVRIFTAWTLWIAMRASPDRPGAEPDADRITVTHVTSTCPRTESTPATGVILSPVLLPSGSIPSLRIIRSSCFCTNQKFWQVSVSPAVLALLLHAETGASGGGNAHEVAGLKWLFESNSSRNAVRKWMCASGTTPNHFSRALQACESSRPNNDKSLRPLMEETFALCWKCRAPWSVVEHMGEHFSWSTRRRYFHQRCIKRLK